MPFGRLFRRLTSKPSTVGAVFFDVGGVIVHSTMEQYVAAGCQYFGCSPTDLGQEISDGIGALEAGKMDSETFWRNIGASLERKGKGHPAPPETCRDLWTSLFQATARLDKKVINLCLELDRSRLAVGVLSNTIEDHVELVHKLGGYQNFKPILLSCKLGHRKPDPKIYQFACQKVMLPPQQCLLVDDNKENCEGAMAVGMQAILYTGYAQLLEDLQRLGVTG